MFDTNTDFVVRGALDGLAIRHRVFTNNLANIETPGFQPGDVSFEQELRRLRDSRTHGPGGSPRLSFQVTPSEQDAHRVDGNGVQADDQVMRLVENTLSYEALLQAQRMRGEILRTTVTEGRK
jgi:flagellar basal-body rod protein FlgB